MLRVVVKSIRDKHVLEDYEYEWIKANLNRPLKIMSMCFDRDTEEVSIITIRADNGEVITLFVDSISNGVEYDLVGGLPIKSYREAPHA